MSLLIVTQKVDINDPILGFFHHWIKEFSKNVDSVKVVCLFEGEHSLSSNISVLSLGKDKRNSRLQYIFNFYRFIWRERKNYETVLVHMNQEYILLGGLLWKLLGKKILFWRNHYSGTLLTTLSIFLSDIVYCTSKYSFTARFKKTKLMPVGVDTDAFTLPKEGRTPNSVLSLGRISRSKNIDLIIKALGELNKRKVSFTANIYGDAPEGEADYMAYLKDLVNSLGLEKTVFFHNGVTNTEVRVIYSRHDIFINASRSGMYDKTIFEAMSSGTIPVVCNRDIKPLIGDNFVFKENDVRGLADKIEAVFKLDKGAVQKYREQMRNIVIEKHSLKKLAESIKRDF